MFELNERVALITGGSRGIGGACSEALAARGAAVVINYREREDSANALVAAIVARGGKAEAVRFDVADAPAVQSAIGTIVARYGRLDILVASAGIAIEGLLLQLPEADLQRLFDVNVKGALCCAKAVLTPMIRKKHGRLVFLSSMVGEIGTVGLTAYGASKAALVGAAKSIAREYAARGITANAVAPGYIETDMTATMNEATKSQALRAVPLGRMGRAEEVAAAVAFLASDEAGYITGQVLRVNGGMYG